MKKLLGLANILIIISLMASSQEKGLEAILQPGAQLEKLADGFSFVEGPTADNDGNVYFTDQPNDRIMVWNEKSGLSLFLQPSGRSNGLALDKKGNLWSCADEQNEIWRITMNREIDVFAEGFDGKLFNGPNDLWIAPSGGIYFTDPFYLRSWWDHIERPQEKQCVYYLKPDLKNIVLAADDLLQPNGIAGTPDGRMLFVADIRAGKTWKFNINADGTLGGRTLFCEMGSDGMAIDSKGNLYLTGRGVTIFDKTGRKLGNIPVPENWSSNVCFGGRDRKFLYITASKSFYRIRLKVKGTAG